MSYAAERWARSQVAGNARAKAVLIELAHCLNGRTGQCTPSVAYLSRVTELKPDTITKATNDLQDRGLITKTVIKTKSGRSCSYRLIGFVHSEWDIHENEDIPENGGIPDSTGTHTPENVVTGNPKNGVTHTPENVVTGNPKNGVTHTPENGDRTGNKNREIEQGSRTENVVPAPASADLFPDATEMIEEKKPKKSRAKAKTQCPFSPDDPIPDEYLAYAKEKHPSIDALKEFRKFVNSAYANGRKYSDWKAAWRTWTANAEDWKPKTTYTQRNAPLRFDDAYYGDGSF